MSYNTIILVVLVVTTTVVARQQNDVRESCQFEVKDRLQVADVRSPGKILVDNSHAHSEAECFNACCNFPKGECNVASFFHRGRTAVCQLLDCEPFESCRWKSAPDSIVAKVNRKNGSTPLKTSNATASTIPPKQSHPLTSSKPSSLTIKTGAAKLAMGEKNVTAVKATPLPVGTTTPSMTVMDSLRAFYDKHVNFGASEKSDGTDELADADSKSGTIKSSSKHAHPVLPEIHDSGEGPHLAEKDPRDQKLKPKDGVMWDVLRLLRLGGDNEDDDSQSDGEDTWNQSDKNLKPKVTSVQTPDGKNAAHDEFLSWSDIEKKFAEGHSDSKHQKTTLATTTKITTQSPTTGKTTPGTTTKKPVGKVEPIVTQNNGNTIIRPVASNGVVGAHNRVNSPGGHPGHVIGVHHHRKNLLEDSMSMLVIVVCSALVLLFLVLLAVCGKVCMGRQPHYKPLRDYDRSVESPALSQTLLSGSQRMS